MQSSSTRSNPELKTIVRALGRELTAEEIVLLKQPDFVQVSQIRHLGSTVFADYPGLPVREHTYNRPGYATVGPIKSEVLKFGVDVDLLGVSQNSELIVEGIVNHTDVIHNCIFLWTAYFEYEGDLYEFRFGEDPGLLEERSDYFHTRHLTGTDIQHFDGSTVDWLASIHGHAPGSMPIHGEFVFSIHLKKPSGLLTVTAKHVPMPGQDPVTFIGYFVSAKRGPQAVPAAKP